jgi:hypothetical protein
MFILDNTVGTYLERWLTKVSEEGTCILSKDIGPIGSGKTFIPKGWQIVIE